MSKAKKIIDSMSNLDEAVELHDADIGTIVDVVNRAYARLNSVTQDAHPDDDQDVLAKLKEAADKLHDGLLILQDLRKNSRNKQ